MRLSSLDHLLQKNGTFPSCFPNSLVSPMKSTVYNGKTLCYQLLFSVYVPLVLVFLHLTSLPLLSQAIRKKEDQPKRNLMARTDCILACDLNCYISTFNNFRNSLHQLPHSSVQHCPDKPALDCDQKMLFPVSILSPTAMCS